MVPEIWLVLLGMVTLAIASVCQLAFPLILGKFIDQLSRTPIDIRASHKLIFALLGITSIMAVTNFINMASLSIAGNRVVQRLRKQLFMYILYREIAFFDTTRTGELISRLSGDVGSVNTALTTELAEICQRFVMVTGAIVYMFYLSWDLTLISLALAPVLGY